MKDNQINIKNIFKHNTVLWMYSNMIFRVHKEIKIMFGKKEHTLNITSSWFCTELAR